jgi:hypothetical protein
LVCETHFDISLIFEFIWFRLCKIEYTNSISFSPNLNFLLRPSSHCDSARRRLPPLPPPYPSQSHTMSSSPPRCGPEEGGKSKWMVRSVPGKPVALVGPKSQFESQLWQQLTHHKCRLQYYLLLGQVLVMCDGKCKSNVVSHGIVTCGCHSGTDMKIGGRQFQRWIRAIFCLKYIPAIFRPFLFPP